MMTEPFDPYHRWLGIPPQEQPPDHYRLLGIGRFEQSPDVIESAADRQMAHLRTYQSGPHGALSQKLLNEVAAAKLCLLDPNRRAAYDARLREAASSPQSGDVLPAVPQPVDPALAAIVGDARQEPGRSRPAGRKQELPLGLLLAGASVTVLALTAGVVWLYSKNDSSGHVAQSQLAKPDPGRETFNASPDRNATGKAKKGGKEKSFAGNSSPSSGEKASKDPDPEKSGPRPKFMPAAGQTSDEPSPDTNDEKPSQPGEGWQPGTLPEAAEEPVKKLPVPDNAAQAKALQLAQEVYNDDLAKAKSPIQKQATAKKLLEAATKTRDDPPARYVLLKMARETATEAGDGQTAFEAADALAETFEVDALPIKAEILAKFSKVARSPEQIRSLMEQAQALAEEALSGARPDIAEPLAEIALANARKFRNPALTKPIVALNKRIKEMAAVREGVEKAKQTLKEKPDDPAANLAVGRFYCFLSGDWDQGLPLLAKGSDPALRALAERELSSPPANAKEQIELADAWWDLAEGRAEEKDAIALHAGTWYEQARGELPEGLEKTKVEKRLETLGSIERPAAASASKGPKTIRPGQWVDLLRYVDPASDATTPGNWEKTATGLATSPGFNARVAIPVSVEGSYELRVEFTRETGNEVVAIILPVGSGTAMVGFGFYGGRYHGLEMIDGQAVRSNPIRVRPGVLVNGQRYTATIGVRVQGDNAEVAVLLNNKPCVRWIGKQASLSLHDAWRLPQGGQFGVGTEQAKLTFHRVSLRLNGGKATVGTKPDAASLPPSP